MKKTYFLCFAALAAFVTVSCSKEIINDNDAPQQANLVPMTFSADCEGTKAILVDTKESTKKDVHWKAGDFISVLGQETGNQQFKANQSGQTTTFEGLAAAKDAKYYAVYPYQDALTLDAENDGVINGVKVPSVQNAVEGSFDPNAYVWAAVSSEKSLTFKTFCALWKLTINDERASEIKSILVKDNDGATIASESGKLTVTDNGDLSHSAEKGVTTIKLLAPAEGFKNGASYFVALRPSKCEHGITIYIEYTDGSVYSKKNESALYPSGTISFSGTVRGITVKASNFTKLAYSEAFELGYNVTVGDNVYNISTTPTYYSLDATTNTVYLNKSKTAGGAYSGGLYFLKGTNFTLDGNWNIANDVVLIGDTDGVKFTNTNANTNYIIYHKTSAKSLLIKNLEMNIAGGYLVLNNDKVNDAEQLVFDSCKITTSGPLLYSYLKSGDNVLETCAVKTLIVKDCDVTLTGNHIVNLGNAKASKIENINITGCTITPSAAARVISLPTWANESTTNPALVFKNNTLNQFTPSTAIISCSGAMQSITVSDNKGSVVLQNGTSYFINNVDNQQNITFDNPNITYSQSTSATSAVMYDSKGGKKIYPAQ